MERHRTHFREVLTPHFPDVEGRSQFTLALQALVALCTTQPGADNVALMAALSSREIKIFVCQNDGAAFSRIQTHLEGVWKALRKLRRLTPLVDNNLPAIHPNKAEIDLIQRLQDNCYTFVAKKALSRAKKRSPLIEQFLNAIESLSTPNYHCDLLEAFDGVARTAMKVVSSSALGEQENWSTFRSFTRVLYNLAAQDEYLEAVEKLQIKINELRKS
jgi:hypothetical protein